MGGPGGSAPRFRTLPIWGASPPGLVGFVG